jgi:ribose transport system substrate-binding protein
MKFKLVVSVLLVLGLVLGLGAVSLVGQQRPKIALFVSTINNPYFVTMAEGAKAAAADFGADLTVFDGQNDSLTQTNQIDAAIAAGYQAILLNPTHQEALIPAVQRANAAGIPVFSVDRDVKGGERVCYIGTSNVLAAEQGAATFITYLAGTKFGTKSRPWNIVILEGIPGASAAVEREKGFKNILKPFIDAGILKVIKDLTAQFDRAEGLRVMGDILATTKDIDGVICANDEMCLGALQALKGAGVPVGMANNGVIIMGFDAIDDAVAAVKAGDFVGTVAQAPFIQGYWGAEAAILYLTQGWRPPAGTPIYEPTGALFIPTPVAIVTAENADTITTITMAKPKLPGT